MAAHGQAPLARLVAPHGAGGITDIERPKATLVQLNDIVIAGNAIIPLVNVGNT